MQSLNRLMLDKIRLGDHTFPIPVMNGDDLRVDVDDVGWPVTRRKHLDDRIGSDRRTIRRRGLNPSVSETMTVRTGGSTTT